MKQGVHVGALLALSQPADPPSEKREGGAGLSYVRLGGSVRMTFVAHNGLVVSCLLCLKKGTNRPSSLLPPTPVPWLRAGARPTELALGISCLSDECSAVQ